MIITCDECTTRFQLDDARIPTAGAKVRCSKCRHAFFVKPEVGAGDAVENAVSQALADDEESESLGSSQDIDPTAALRGPDDQTAQEAIDEFEESDWEFNTDSSEDSGDDHASFQEPPGLPLDGDDGAAPALDDAPGIDAAQEAIDDLLGAGGDDVGEDVDELFDTSPGVDHGIDALLDGGADEPQDTTTASLPALPAPESGSQLPGLEASGDPVETALAELGLDPDAETAPDLGLDLDADPNAVPEPGLGSNPDEWDFFAGESDAAPAPGGSQSVAIGRTGVSAGSQAALRPPMDVDTEASPVAIWGRRGVQGIGWTAVAALTAVILYQSLWSASRVASAAPPVQTVAGLVASSLEGRWVENLTGGSVYVISGELRRQAGQPSPAVQLVVRLFDASGGLLEDQAAVVGPELDEPQLRETSLSALLEGQAAGSLALAMGFPIRTR